VPALSLRICHGARQHTARTQHSAGLVHVFRDVIGTPTGTPTETISMVFEKPRRSLYPPASLCQQHWSVLSGSQRQGSRSLLIRRSWVRAPARSFSEVHTLQQVPDFPGCSVEWPFWRWYPKWAPNSENLIESQSLARDIALAQAAPAGIVRPTQHSPLQAIHFSVPRMG